MVYLIIPVLCFLFFAALGAFLLQPLVYERTRRGKIDNLDVILPVVMTSGLDSASLFVKTEGEGSGLKMTFPDSMVRLRIFLKTDLAQERREACFGLLRNFDPAVRRLDNGERQEFLEYEFEKPSENAVGTIKDLILKLLTTEPATEVEFRVYAPSLDHYVIAEALEEVERGEKAQPVAATQGREILEDSVGRENSAKSRSSCLQGVALLFLRPLPFMFAHLEFGYVAASGVLMAMILLGVVYRRWKWKKYRSNSGLADFSRAGAFALAGATVYFSDPLYLQLILTGILAAVALAEFLPVSFKLSRSMLSNGEDEVGPERWFFVFAIVVTCAGGAALNEYLRATLTLDAWMWFFAFCRFELALGFFFSMLPAFVHLWRRLEAEEEEKEKSMEG